MRCKTCKGIYESQQGNYLYFHTCPLQIRNPAGKLIPTPNPRNENIQDHTESLEELMKRLGKTKRLPKPSIKAAGAGVESV